MALLKKRRAVRVRRHAQVVRLRLLRLRRGFVQEINFSKQPTLKPKKETKFKSKTIALALAAAVCGAAFADEATTDGKSESWSYTPGEGVSFDETPIVSAEASLSFDSKYLSYGFVDNKAPILTSAGEITFNLLGEEDDTLTLRPSIAQGFGNGQRVKAYATKKDGEPLNHAGLMDTMIKLELVWMVCDNVALSGYVEYSDFLFDRKIRDAARDYEATGSWDDGWNVVAGLALTISL